MSLFYSNFIRVRRGHNTFLSKRKTVTFFSELVDIRANGSPYVKPMPSPIDICYIKGLIKMLPAFRMLSSGSIADDKRF